MNGPENSSVVGRKQNERVGESGEMRKREQPLVPTDRVIRGSYPQAGQAYHRIHMTCTYPTVQGELYLANRTKYASSTLLSGSETVTGPMTTSSDPSQSMHQENRFKVQISAPASLIDE